MSAPLPRELELILRRQEMAGERTVNRIRFWFCVLNIVMLASVAEINTPEANRVYAWQTGAWLAYSVALWAYFRVAGLRYVPWLKYLSITVDLGMLTVSAFGSAVNHAGLLEYFRSFIPVVFIFLNMLSGFRLSLAACLYSAFLTAAFNVVVLVYAVSSGAVAVSPVAVYGEPAINIGDQSATIVFLAIPGVLAGLIARTSRRLVLRAEEETLARARTERQRDRLRKYLSKDLAEVVLANPGRLELGGKRTEATIMFTDIRNFTPFTESREPEEVVAMLNGYFTEMVEIVFRYGGTLDKFLGDGLMAVFGVPFEQPDAPVRATLCALEMQAAVERFNARLGQSPDRPPIRIGIGIALGAVIAGNIGSLDRMEYTCIGDAVNYASRLEGLNRDLGSSILLDEASAEAVVGLVPLRRTPPLRVKGKRGEVEPSVLDPAAVTPDHLEALRAALAGGARMPLTRPVAAEDGAETALH